MVLASFGLSSCYYDNYEDLYHYLPTETCDTPLSSYGNDIQPWISDQCISCHNSTLSEGSLDLSTYENVKDHAASILDRISRAESDAWFMPQGGSSLSSCKINGFATWIDLGTPQN